MENELEAWQKLHKFYLYNNYLTKDLAAYLKVSPRTIQRWLKGKTHPTQEELSLIKKYLHENSKREIPD
jgi:transcriptional regulator with XRE-family HTH domain